ncbi:hypothetical protein LSH36_268g02014 [Paralvinella palmiformis]|uniref:Uncharacterized protein n=1 Tax=Paralvinella palmiformis TaxID=53620 RepID=A0AAD9JKT0_9ANNE|nr:hypothetical protein LSH36_268g02014 [Paralvinella palmiformis]
MFYRQKVETSDIAVMATSQLVTSDMEALTVNGDTVMATIKGKVTVVTALTSNCQLDSLHERFSSEKKDIILYGINSAQCPSKQSLEQLRASVHFPIYQDNVTNRFWQRLGLKPQDIQVYNREMKKIKLCYLLTFHSVHVNWTANFSVNKLSNLSVNITNMRDRMRVATRKVL